MSEQKLITDRRGFLTASAAVATAATATAAAPTWAAGTSAPRDVRYVPKSPMKLGTFVADVTDASMKEVRRWGISNIYARAPIGDPNRLYPTVDELHRMRDTAERNGVHVDILRPIDLAMTNIDEEKHPAIMLGESPQRDRDIEQLQLMIRNCAAAGIPAMRYTLSIVGNTRSMSVRGRGDSSYVGSRMADYRTDREMPVSNRPLNRTINKPITRAGRVTADMYWDRITYFLERMVPVANEYKVRILCHPEDAMVPDPYEGVDLVDNTVVGMKKFVSIRESPYHGVLFCVGTFSEMLENPRKDIYDVIRWFGDRQKIFMVDFRNIRGNREEFVETFPDDGDIDMYRVVETLKHVGYGGMLCPDHTPVNPGGPAAVMAFQYGYIRALLQASEHIA